MTAFPAYTPPLGTPAYWRNDVSGQLPAVVMAYFAHGSGHGGALTHAQLVLLRDYCAYVISAPCWKGPELAELRSLIAQAQSERQIDAWIEACLESGIDPL